MIVGTVCLWFAAVGRADLPWSVAALGRMSVLTLAVWGWVMSRCVSQAQSECEVSWSLETAVLLLLTSVVASLGVWGLYPGAAAAEDWDTMRVVLGAAALSLTLVDRIAPHRLRVIAVSAAVLILAVRLAVERSPWSF